MTYSVLKVPLNPNQPTLTEWNVELIEARCLKMDNNKSDVNVGRATKVRQVVCFVAVNLGAIRLSDLDQDSRWIWTRSESDLH